jgi:hypothetical protein
MTPQEPTIGHRWRWLRDAAGEDIAQCQNCPVYMRETHILGKKVREYKYAADPWVLDRHNCGVH